MKTGNIKVTKKFEAECDIEVTGTVDGVDIAAHVTDTSTHGVAEIADVATVSAEIDADIATHKALPNDHHNESHDIDSHTGTSLTIDDLNESTTDHGIEFGCDISMGGNGGLLNEVASSTNPVIIPNISYPNTGIGYSADNRLCLIANSVRGIQINESAGVPTVYIYGNMLSANNYWSIQNVSPTATVPIYCPNGDTDTGMGSFGADVLSLIAGGVEGIRISESAGSITTNFTDNITLSGTVDGRDIDTDGTKLDTIDTNADVTGSNPPQAHTVASHSDTTATGAQLNTLVGGGETALHSHAGGSGDMLKSTYDTNANDRVDTSDSLYDAGGNKTYANISAEIDSDISTHAALDTTHGVTGDIVGTTDSQALSNKTIPDNLLLSYQGIADYGELHGEDSLSGTHGLIRYVPDVYVDVGNASDDLVIRGTKISFYVDGNTCAILDNNKLEINGIDEFSPNTGVTIEGLKLENSTITGETKEHWIDSWTRNTGGEESSLGIRLDNGVDDYVVYQWVVPADYNSITSVVAHYCASTDESAGNVDLSFGVNGAAIGEGYTTHDNNDNNNIIAIAANDQYTRRSYTTSGLFTNISAGDILQIICDRNNTGSDTYGGNIFFSGFLITYTT